jgi:hypothetical protein
MRFPHLQNNQSKMDWRSSSSDKERKKKKTREENLPQHHVK